MILCADRTVPVSFIKKLRKTEGQLNFPLVLECKVFGTTPVDISWYKDNMEIFHGEKYRLSFDNVTASITIVQTQTSDCGNYTCKASNKAGKDTCSAPVTIIEIPTAIPPEEEEEEEELEEPSEESTLQTKSVVTETESLTSRMATEPAIFQNKLRDVSQKAGDVAVFTCSFSGTSNISVVWLRQNMELENSHKYNIINKETSATLEIANVRKSDEGSYQCRIQNHLAQDFCFATLSVTGAYIFFYSYLSLLHLKHFVTP
uniref:Ig-like domain-containing protein n=1 Tax=Eptatretus burgeri TaxID=7764 RepID=A0A8C4NPK1_EPTBU